MYYYVYHMYWGLSFVHYLYQFLKSLEIDLSNKVGIHYIPTSLDRILKNQMFQKFKEQ